MHFLAKLDKTVQPERDTDVNAERSFNRIRVFAGALGLALPVALLLGDRAFLVSNATVRGSLSAYYHSGMRDVFVGTLVATGVCLVAYRITDKGDRRNGISTFAGFMAILVAVFPTGIPKELKDDVESVTRTPLQKAWGEGTVSLIHGVSAFLLIAALCVMSTIFWRRERIRQLASQKDAQRRLHKIGVAVHLGCVVLMLASCSWIGINFALKEFAASSVEDFLLYGEWGAVWGFAISFETQGFIHRKATKG